MVAPSARPSTLNSQLSRSPPKPWMRMTFSAPSPFWCSATCAPSTSTNCGAAASSSPLFRRRRHIGCDIFIDLAVGDRGIGDDADQRLDRIDRYRPRRLRGAGVRRRSPRRSRRSCRSRLRGSASPGLICVPALIEPAGDLPLLHGEAPFRHDDRNDALVGHQAHLNWPWCAERRRRSAPRSGYRDLRAPARTAPACAARSPSGCRLSAT